MRIGPRRRLALEEIDAMPTPPGKLVGCFWPQRGKPRKGAKLSGEIPAPVLGLRAACSLRQHVLE